MTNHSPSQSKDTPTDESTKRDVDMASKDTSPQEKSGPVDHGAPEVDASPPTSPPNAEVADSFINSAMTDAKVANEDGAEREHAGEETGTEPEEVRVHPENVAQHEPQDAYQHSPSSLKQAPTHYQDDNVEQNEPVVSKQAVQDPGLVDDTDLPPEDTNVIDVDSFEDDEEDDVSDDDVAQSPTAPEFASEAEDPDDPKNVDTMEVLAPYAQGQAIDLTDSPSPKPLESGKQFDNAVFKINNTPATEQAEPVPERSIDIDDTRDKEEAEAKGASRGSGSQDDTGSMTKSYEHSDEGTPDTDTVSADVNIDTNGDDISPQQSPKGDDSASLPTKAAVDIAHSADEAGRIVRDAEQPMTATRTDDAGDNENGRNDSNGKTQSETSPADILDVDNGDDMNRNMEVEIVQAELEDSNVKNDTSNMPMSENKSIDDASAVIAFEEKVAPKAEEDEAVPSSIDELQAEKPHEKSLHSLPSDGQDARYHKSSEAALRSDKAGEVMPVPGGENQSSFDLVASDGPTSSKQLDSSSKLQGEKAQVEPIASVIKNSVPTRLPVSAELQSKGSFFIEKTDRAKPVEPDVEISAVATEIHGSAPNETASSTEPQLLSSGLKPQKLVEEEQMKLDNDSKMDVDTASAESKDSKERKVAAELKASSSMKANSDKSVPPFESKDEGSQIVEKGSTKLDRNSKVAESDADQRPEQSKATGTGHQAPLFGIQLSMPMKTGPVSFSSPPTFPRYSLNPQAVPFLPFKPGNSDGSPEKSKTIVVPIATDPDAANQEKISETEAQTERVSVVEGKNALGRGAVLGDISAKTEGLSPKETSSTVVGSDVHPSDVFRTPAIAPADKTTKSAAPTEYGVEGKPVSESESFLKKPTLKKVSFAPTPVKNAVPLQKLGKGQVMQSISTIEKTVPLATKDNSISKLDRQSALVDTSSESSEAARLGKAPTESDVVKEKQRIIQVQTDEGLRREVANVTVAIRQDNSKMKLDRKKLTIQLTTGTEESAKLQFFKGSGSSLKLYASLESKKDYLRVRKVTNRKYCMSVAKVAPPGDEAADIAEKYFVHFDELDIFEEMYSQCVANLQKQPKSMPHLTEPDRSKRTPQTSGEESTKESNRQSITKTGVKRSAESDNPAQASKKSKLLADKQKLLDKMAALRRKKEQKGVAASKGRQSKQVAAPSARSSLPPADTGTRKSTQVTDKQVHPKSENTETNTTETPLVLAKVTHPSKKRANEKASKENVSKRARIKSSLSAVNEANVAIDPKSGAESDIGQSASANPRTASRDDAQGDSTEAKPIPSTQPNSSKGLQSVVNQKPRTTTDTKLPDVHSDSPKQTAVEAFVKVTKDLQQVQKEMDALQQELVARNHSLSLERAKTSQVQRENSEAWKRIMSIVEALDDDMGRLRRDETDRSMESLKRCEPSSSEDFFDRLHSFRPSTWTAFEDREIGALECALKGWHNSGPNTIQSSEGSEITLSSSYDDLNFRSSEVERVSSLLREGHNLLSGWIGQACPESFRTIVGSQRILTKENLKANTEMLRGQGFDGGDFRFDWGANALLLSDDVCERLAVYNWNMDGECLRCTWCNRRVVVQRESRFQATSKHYAFCPFRSESWKDSVLFNARTLGIEGGDDVLMRD